MTRCTKCDKEWSVSIQTDLKDYECPHCCSKRKRASESAKFASPQKNILQVKYSRNIGGKQ